MAPRKRELLDVLRHQQGAGEGEPQAAPTAPRDVRFRFRFGPKQRRAWLRVALVVLWLVLVVWLVRLLLGEGDAPTATGGDRPAAAGAGDASVAAASGFGVLAITFQGESNRQSAVELALRLKTEAALPDVTLHETRGSGKVFYEIFVGSADDPAALQPLLQRVRSLALPGMSSGQFTTALIKRRPASNS